MTSVPVKPPVSFKSSNTRCELWVELCSNFKRQKRNNIPSESCLSSTGVTNMSRLTPTDRATRCVTPSRHHAVHKAGRWVWSTGDGRRSTVDNTWRRSTWRREIILGSEVGEKSQTELRLLLETSEVRVCLKNILQRQGALYSRPEDLDPVGAWPQTLCIGSKSSTRNDCIDLPPWSK